MMVKKKKQKSGDIKVQLWEIAYESFSDMSYFNKWVPEGCKLVRVQICHEFGYWDEDPDQAYLSIEWELEE